ncbi:hypothetical protein C2S51_002954 [Perilla frutescens var. frutescens]|nr:hypothetical protein C2S51_002954 [Perilla frutescens var. frutescens]
MEGRRRNNHRKSQNRKPPCGFWQPTVPAWEKEFCKVVGSMDWETLMHMKKFMHFYDNVIEWNDSAGEEAFSNAKKRYWAKKKGLSCNISLPDPDLYIDKINWDSEIDPELSDVESLSMSSKTEEDHDPVVIFGDSATPNQVLPPTGWGDDEENFVAPATRPSANYVDPWGHSLNEWATAAWSGYSNDGWQGYSNDAWQYSNGSGHGYMPWEGDWSNWSCNYANNYNYVGPDIRDTWDDGDQRHWNENSVPMAESGECVSSYKTTRAQANEQRRKHMPRIAEDHNEAPYKRE